MSTELNDRDVREIIGIVDVSTTKKNGDIKEEEIEQINIHTKVDILQINWLIRISIAPYLSIYFHNEY